MGVIAEPKAAQTIAGLTAIPSFPPVALRVMELLSTEALDLPAIAAAVESDAVFAGRILQHANSPEFAFTSPIESVHRALVLLGAARVREIAATVATSLYMRAASKTEELRRCWRHSLACAVLSETLARAAGVHQTQAYTAGLMHDIGRLAIFVAYPEQYIDVVREAAFRCIDLLDFERESFGMQHAEAGCWLVEHWGLPDYFRVIAGRHHDPPDGTELDLLTIVHLACHLADALGFEVSTPLKPQSVGEILSDFPASARARLPEDLQQLVQQRIDRYDLKDAVPLQISEPVPDTVSKPEVDQTEDTVERPVIDPRIIILGAIAAIAVVALWVLVLRL